MDKREIKDVLAELMRIRQVNQTALSEKSGVPQPTISRILKGAHKTLELETIRSLAAFFNVSLDQMAGDEPLDTDSQWFNVKRMWMGFAKWKKVAAESTVKALSELNNDHEEKPKGRVINHVGHSESNSVMRGRKVEDLQRKDKK